MSIQPSRYTMAAVILAIVLIAGLGIAYAARGNRGPGGDSGSRDRTPGSIQKLDDHPLYVMTYDGDYGFQEYLKTGAQPRSSSLVSPGPDWACTCFAALNPQGDPLYGRNFDWDNDPILVLFTDSSDGYASISTVDAKYLEITGADLSQEDRKRLLSAPYLPFDGMNEYGLVVGMMAVEVDPPYDPGRVSIGSLAAIRLMLDYAKTVDEAVSLIGQYNIDFQGGPGIHYLVSDRSGESAVIEFTGGTMSVLRSEKPWQVSTNFVITGKTPDQARSSCIRYATADKRLEESLGRLNMDEALSLLGEVSQPSTLWSVVYNMRSGETRFTMRRNIEKVYPFQLQMRNN